MKYKVGDKVVVTCSHRVTVNDVGSSIWPPYTHGKIVDINHKYYQVRSEHGWIGNFYVNSAEEKWFAPLLPPPTLPLARPRRKLTLEA